MIEKRIKDIVEELKSTPEFLAFKQAQSKLAKDSELKKRVEQFLEDNARLLGQPGGRSTARYNEMNERFAELSKIPEAAAYFEAGRDFEAMAARLYQFMDDLIGKALRNKRG